MGQEEEKGGRDVWLGRCRKKGGKGRCYVKEKVKEREEKKEECEGKERREER